MAEIVLSAFLAVLFENLSSAAYEKLACYKGINSDIKMWKRSLSQIQDVLNDASQKEITNESVKRWLNDLQHLAYDIDDVLDDLATEAKHQELSEDSRAITGKVRKFVPTCCTSFSLSTSKHDDKLKIITIKLEDLVKEKTTLGLSIKDERSKSINRRFESSLVDASSIVGRQEDKEALLHQLLADEQCNQNFSIVPIVGMGGVGKTTLARVLYDEKKAKDHFDLKAWVCVSNEFDSFNVSKVIFQSVTGENKIFEDLNLLQVALRDQLIVLDDVWSESYDDRDRLVDPFHAGALSHPVTT